MPKKNILVGDDDKQSEVFLTEYFSETKSIPIFAKSQEDLLDAFVMNPEFVFVKVDWLDKALFTTLSNYKKSKPAAKFFSIGYARDETFKWDNQFEVPFEPKAFRKTLLGEIAFPPKVKLLIVDDEEGILELFKDFFELQKDPIFEVTLAKNGLEGFEKVKSARPDVVVLDLKMPVRNGAELYSDIQNLDKKIPCIVFIDSTSAEEIGKVRKFGNPVFVEKSGHRSSMQEMLGIVKKMIAFA